MHLLVLQGDREEAQAHLAVAPAEGKPFGTRERAEKASGPSVIRTSRHRRKLPVRFLQEKEVLEGSQKLRRRPRSFQDLAEFFRTSSGEERVVVPSHLGESRLVFVVLDLKVLDLVDGFPLLLRKLPEEVPGPHGVLDIEKLLLLFVGQL